jgi:hypothetical protein
VLGGVAVGRGFEPQSDLELFFAEILMNHLSLKVLSYEFVCYYLNLNFPVVCIRQMSRRGFREMKYCNITNCLIPDVFFEQLVPINDFSVHPMYITMTAHFSIRSVNDTQASGGLMQ